MSQWHFWVLLIYYFRFAWSSLNLHLEKQQQTVHSFPKCSHVLMSFLHSSVFSAEPLEGSKVGGIFQFSSLPPPVKRFLWILWIFWWCDWLKMTKSLNSKQLCNEKWRSYTAGLSHKVVSLSKTTLSYWYQWGESWVAPFSFSCHRNQT